MGSMAVLSMADAVNTGAPEAVLKPVHPFFTASRNAKRDSDVNSEDTALTEATDTSICSHDGTVDTGTTDTPTLPKRRGRPRKRKSADGEDLEDQDTDTVKKARPKKRPRSSLGGNIVHHFKKQADHEPNTENGTGDSDHSAVHQDEDVNTATPSSAPGYADGSQDLTPVDQGLTTAVELPAKPKTEETPATPSRPKKLLQLNTKTGTIGSPPKPKQEVLKDVGKKASPMPRGGSKGQTKIVGIQYGKDATSREDLGERINEILNGKVASQTKKATADGVPAKSTHPFFLGKSAKAGDKPPASEAVQRPKSASVRHKQFSSTPCSPKKVRAGPASSKAPQFGVKSIGLKVPGSKPPAWPWKDAVHIRGEELSIAGAGQYSSAAIRKSKGNAVEISQSESIIECLAGRLHIPEVAEEVRTVNTDDFLPPPTGLRLPQKHFESGRKLQVRILAELKCRKAPQLAKLLDSVQTSLSAFDQSKCESSCWTQKYAPSSALEILQAGKEAFLLKEWLQALVVQSVDTGGPDEEKTKSKTQKPSGGGRKKKRKKLDDFIVSSDEEGLELEEVSDNDADWAPSGTHGITRKTVVRSGGLLASKGAKELNRLTNTVIISGPHGSGKTAAVYAVAKELDFEVFEINPSSRRSGRDVLERIGDMTRNHLVQQQPSGNAPAENPVVVEDDEVAEDVRSGKQATMNSFFKLKTDGKPKKVPAAVTEKSKLEPAKKDSPKNQRQSLILLDEADILYEEDRQFWATVVGLMAQSKRPFVITCNDETLLPLQTLSLYGIFRFTPPPADIAVDRLLLVAGNEGHALRRDAVEALYESRNFDFRAALTDLNYWCQFGVGDRKGGFGWFYLRWPKGVDLDEQGDVVRVVSEDTFQTGMNWLVRDTLTGSSAGQVEEELLQQAWESWNFDVGQWQDTLDLPAWAANVGSATTTPTGRAAVLEDYDAFCEAMSAADVCSSMAFATNKEEPLDVTLPDLSEKTRDDYVLGLQLLDAPILTRYQSMALSLSLSLKSKARDVLQQSYERHSGMSRDPVLNSFSENRVISSIRRRFTETSPSEPKIARIDMAFAFDPLAVSDMTSSLGGALSYLDPSVFDRTMKLITLDVAPYVRSIVAYDARLQKQRLKLSSLMSEGGQGRSKGNKRMRTTRAAMSALEGGSRSTTRAEKWFKADLNVYLVLRTGGEDWDKLVVPDLPEDDRTKDSSDESVALTPKKELKRGKVKRKVIHDDSSDELGDSGVPSPSSI